MLALLSPPYVLGRVTRTAGRAGGAAATHQQELIRRRGGPRRAGPDRPRAARRDRPLGQRHGGADRRRAGPGPRATRAAPSRSSHASRTPVAGPSPRPAGCCTCSATPTTSSGLRPTPGPAGPPRAGRGLRATGLRVDLVLGPDRPHQPARRGGRLVLPHRAGGADQRAALRRGPGRQRCRSLVTRDGLTIRSSERLRRAGLGRAAASAWLGLAERVPCSAASCPTGSPRPDGSSWPPRSRSMRRAG